MKLQEKSKFVEGIFGIETYSEGKLVNTYTQKNAIMVTARNNMSNLIAGFTAGTPINKIVLGDFGHDAGDLLTPKTFAPERSQLFSEGDEFLTQIAFDAATKTITYGGTTTLGEIANLDTIRIEGSKLNNGDYSVTGSNTTAKTITVSEAIVDEPTGSKVIITKDPLGTPVVYNTDGLKDGHTFDATFVAPAVSGLATMSEVTNTADVAYGTIDDVTVEIDSTGNLTKYIIFIPQNKAINDHTDGTTVVAYTEAALYAGDNIFSMRTFPARTKDENLEFKITWSITF